MTAEATIRVLLVDDHKSILWGYTKLIDGERPRMEVVGTASTRAQAFAAAAELRPDVILLDIDLGDDGSTLEFLPELMGRTEAHVLILTGVRQAEIHDRAIELGAKGVVLKEEMAEVIIQAIAKVHSGQYWQSEATTRVLNRKTGAAREKAPQAPEGIDKLTPAEMEIIEEIIRNPTKTNEEIARSLKEVKSVKTLNNQLTSIYSKLGVKGRLDLFMYATKHGLAKFS